MIWNFFFSFTESRYKDAGVTPHMSELLVEIYI